MSKRPNITYKKLFVGKLADETREAELEELFKQYGEVGEVAIIRSMNVSKRFGFVHMDSDACDSAIEGVLIFFFFFFFSFFEFLVNPSHSF